MLHVRIRSPHDAFHFIGEVNPYNLQTLQHHIRQSLRENGRLTVAVQIDPADEPLFSRYAADWLHELGDRGTAVHVDAAPIGSGAALREPRPPRMVVTLTAGGAPTAAPAPRP